jgi:hypothetical protein
LQLYGERSANLAKTYKVIGTLHIILNNPNEAKNYLTLAAQIFEQRGMLKMLKEVRQKIKMLQANNR